MSETKVKEPETSKEWWDRIKNDPEAFKGWLSKQHAGEDAAAERISAINYKYTKEGSVARFLLNKITNDEIKHAVWIEQVIKMYMPEVVVVEESRRYWDEVEPKAEELDNFNYFCAVAAYAETMRLERIKAIAEDDEFGLANPFLQKTFKRILLDETFHAEAFTLLAGNEAMWAAAGNHHAGMEAIGLVI
jgi:hypothetical protein